MKAIVMDQPGGPECLKMYDKPDLKPAPGLLTIDVAYAGVGYFEVLLSRGEFMSAFPISAYIQLNTIVSLVAELSTGEMI